MSKKDVNQGKPGKTRAVLSKSTFIRGLQCEKSLYLHKKRPFLRDKLSAEQRAKFNRGTKVGEFARELFPGGVNAEPKTHFQMGASVIKTAEYIAAGHKIIYEAAFEYNGVIIALDILFSDDEGWKAVEVKSSLAVSETYLWDAALQYHVINGSGISLKDIFIAHIDHGYIKEGDHDPHRLFRLQSVMGEVIEREPLITSKIASLKEVVKLGSSPAVPLGTHCHDPYPCDFLGHCYKRVPPVSVMQLKDLPKEKRFELYNSGIVNPSELPQEIIHEYPMISRQIMSISEGVTITDVQKLDAFFEKAHEAVIFFSIMWDKPALPQFDGIRPYQCMPFSLGVSFWDKSEKEDLVLVAPPGAPMQAGLISQFLEVVNQYKACLVVFDAHLNLSILRSIVSGNSMLEKAIDDLMPGMLDVKQPFADNSVIWPFMEENSSPSRILHSMKKKFRKSASIQAAQLYNDLAVSDNESYVEAGITTISEYHKEDLHNLRVLWETLQGFLPNG